MKPFRDYTDSQLDEYLKNTGYIYERRTDGSLVVYRTGENGANGVSERELRKGLEMLFHRTLP